MLRSYIWLKRAPDLYSQLTLPLLSPLSESFATEKIATIFRCLYFSLGATIGAHHEINVSKRKCMAASRCKRSRLSEFPTMVITKGWKADESQESAVFDHSRERSEESDPRSIMTLQEYQHFKASNLKATLINSLLKISISQVTLHLLWLSFTETKWWRGRQESAWKERKGANLSVSNHFQQFLGHSSSSHPPNGFPGRRPTSPGHCPDSILHVICGICMTGPVCNWHLCIVLRLLILVGHHNTYRTPKSVAFIVQTCKAWKSSIRNMQSRGPRGSGLILVPPSLLSSVPVFSCDYPTLFQLKSQISRTKQMSR